MRLTRSIAAVAGIALIAGCGSQGDSTGAAPAPSATQKVSAQESAASLEALASTMDLANDAIISDGTNTTTAGTSAIRDTIAESTFDFSESGSVTVDLDQTDSDGHDLHPNATGVVTIAWSGAVSISQPTHTFGQAAYDVSVHYDQACVFTDPRNGNTATIAADSALSYSLDLDWFRESDDNWYVDAVADHGATAFDVTTVCAGVTRQAIIDGTRHATGHLGYQGGVLSASKTVTSYWTVQTSGPGGNHTVIWDRPALNQIFIVVDGTRFGPYTLAQARAIVGAHIDED